MNDYTDSTKKVFLMSLPIFVELLLQLLVGNIDQIMLSRFSQAAVAAIGNANQIINIIIIVLTLMASAALVLNSQYLGAHDTKRTYSLCHVVMLVIGVCALFSSFLTICFPRFIFGLINVPDDVMDGAVSYLSIIGLGFILQEVMITAVVMNLLNIVGNAILINGLFFFPQMGISGAAVSTDISKLIGLVMIYIIFRRKTGIRFSLKYFKPFPWNMLKTLLSIGIPTGAESFSYNLSQIAILAFINIFGTNVIATRVYGYMFANVAYLYSMAIAQSTQITLGYLVGAKELDKVPRRIYITTVICMAVSVSVTILIYLNSDFLFGIFTSEPEILALGKKVMFIEIFLEIGRSVNIVMTRALVAIGDVMFPVIIGIGSQWFVSVIASYIVGVKLGFGLQGIWIAMAFDEGLRGVLFLIRFKMGTWRKKVYKA